MAIKVGGMFVSLAASAAKFDADMRKAREAARKTGSDMKSSFDRAHKSSGMFSGGIGMLKGALIGVAGPAALGYLIKQSIDAADKLAKTADAAGVSTDWLQEMQVAADLAGVSQESFNGALKAFSKRVGEAQSGTGTLITLLDKMDKGLLANVQAAQTTEQAFDLIIRAGADMESQLERNALFAAAFGRTAGIEMSNMVKNGADSLDNMRQKARDLGLVIDEKLLRNAESAKDSLTLMSRVVSSNLTSAVLTLAPQITDLATRFTDGLPALFAYVNKFLEWTGIIRESPLQQAEAELAGINAQLAEMESTASKPAEKIDWFSFSATDPEISISPQVDSSAVDNLIARQQELIDQIAQLKQAEADRNAAAMAQAKAEVAEQMKVVQTQQERIAAEKKRETDLKAFTELFKSLTTDQFNLQREKLDENIENWRAAGASEIEIEKVKTEELKRIQADQDKFKSDQLKGFNDLYAGMTTTRFEQERAALEENLVAWQEAGASQTELERVAAEERKRIAQEEMQSKLGLVQQYTNQIMNVGNQWLEYEKALIQKELSADIDAENTKFENDKATITKKYTVRGKVTAKGLEKLGELEEAHQASIQNLRDQAAQEEKKAAKKLKPIKVAQAISNTAVEASEVLAKPFKLAAVLAAGALQVATIKAQPYAKGGVVDSPTFFSQRKRTPHPGSGTAAPSRSPRDDGC